MSGSEADYKVLIDNFSLINDTSKETFFSYNHSNEPIEKFALLDFNEDYVLNMNPDGGFLCWRKLPSAYFTFKLVDVEGYSWEFKKDSESIKEDYTFCLYFKNGIRITLFKDKFRDSPFMHIHTKSTAWLDKHWNPIKSEDK
ncbi:MAG: hypothetical protein KJ569_07165 [Candidatus Omnitrophica bacterium]|nr:hypothetical protein [Candidatus Omnitrophota bacterium]MBU1134673.1 hypothetical protein [Candidatus Omnitrophota bacterium]MBU1810994.1 hypothetical protein [Candidatus Omnitrophota bacterium]MBU2437024.1 hypothetical protein [Candidatus Omnitrophota bacterium]